MLFGLLATNDTAIGSTALHATLKIPKLSVKRDFSMSNGQEYFLLKLHPRIQLTQPDRFLGQQ